MAGVRRVDRGDVLLEILRVDAPVALERELHVGGGDDVAVVELHPFAQDEVVHQTIG